jgi:hypothetical protein
MNITTGGRVKTSGGPAPGKYQPKTRNHDDNTCNGRDRNVMLFLRLHMDGACIENWLGLGIIEIPEYQRAYAKNDQHDTD